MRSLVTGLRAAVRVGALSLAPLVIGCAGPGRYTWVTELPPQPEADADYVVRDGDLLDIQVFNQPAMVTHGRVRADGKIAVPLVGDVDVRGKRPSMIRTELEARLKDYVNTPSVTVNVPEMQPITIVVLGEVSRPGVFPVERRASVAQVLALAGGLTDYAGRDSIFVVRRGPTSERVRFTYDGLVRGEQHAAAFPLHDGDLIVAE
jgi:polysaccharide export outer membrane protein